VKIASNDDARALLAVLNVRFHVGRRCRPSRDPSCRVLLFRASSCATEFRAEGRIALHSVKVRDRNGTLDMPLFAGEDIADRFAHHEERHQDEHHKAHAIPAYCLTLSFHAIQSAWIEIPLLSSHGTAPIVSSIALFARVPETRFLLWFYLIGDLRPHLVPRKIEGTRLPMWLNVYEWNESALRLSAPQSMTLSHDSSPDA